MRTGKINPISVSGFWLLLFVSVGTLALGAFASLWPLGETTKGSLIEIHISLGLTLGILLVLQLLLISFPVAFGAGDGEADGKRRTAKLLRGVLYLLILALIATGLAGTYYRGDTLSFWGHPLAAWEYVDLSTSDLLQAVHRDAGYALAALLGVYVALALANLLWPASPPPGQGELATVHAAGQSDQIGRLIADGLSQNFRFFGAAVFWTQLCLGVASGLLLAFGYVGHTVSPGGSRFDAITWASVALVLLVVSAFFTRAYMRAARRLKTDLSRYLGYDRRGSFWFVTLGVVISGLGALISFVGVGLSVALLIGKTVSQPPGIAITDPNKIIRALDVFVLLVNFSLLFAHFVGFGAAAWLSISALKARHQYVIAMEAGKSLGAQLDADA
jgi:cytochrome b561